MICFNVVFLTHSFIGTKNSFAPLKEYKCHTPIINSDLPMLKDAFGL